MPSEIWKGDEIRYWDLVDLMFRDDGRQKLVPFLGAGISISDRNDHENEPNPTYPDEATVSKIAAMVKVDGPARVYLEYALRMAARMQAWVAANGELPDRDRLRERLAAAPYPPSARELADLFSHLATYHSFMDRAVEALTSRELLSEASRRTAKDQLLPMLKLAAMTTDLTGSVDPLTSIAEYYAANDRQALWTTLHKLISTKTQPTTTHKLIAEAAMQYRKNELHEHYVVVTTNYDTLMERALDALEIPYVVLWKKWGDGLVSARIANVPEPERQRFEENNQPRAAENCVLNTNRKVVIVYKMHGCLFRDLGAADDGLVITDTDYVNFISAQSIPAAVQGNLGAQQLLFLGYSFTDWNVRSVYETAIRRTAKTDQPRPLRDYAVTRSLSTYERRYFEKRNITIVLTDLASFSDGIRKELKRR